LERASPLSCRHGAIGHPACAWCIQLWTAWQKFAVPVAPDALLLSATGFGALCINLYCAFLLARFRKHSGSLTRAAFLSARNDAFANIAIITAGVITAATVSPWPALVVGLGIFLINLDAAREVFTAARSEHTAASIEAQQQHAADDAARRS
jgi:Co/Zn/Cd efflux system component